MLYWSRDYFIIRISICLIVQMHRSIFCISIKCLYFDWNLFTRDVKLFNLLTKCTHFTIHHTKNHPFIRKEINTERIVGVKRSSSGGLMLCPPRQIHIYRESLCVCLFLFCSFSLCALHLSLQPRWKHILIKRGNDNTCIKFLIFLRRIERSCVWKRRLKQTDDVNSKHF